MKKTIYLLICLILLIIGSLFFLYQESCIVFFWPNQQQLPNHSLNQNSFHKQVTLWCLRVNNRQSSNKKETAEIMFSDDVTQNIKLLLNKWFLFLEEENTTSKQIIVQSVAISPSGGEAFISINQYPFDKDESTYCKLMIMESLLKTVRENGIPISSIRLLINSQPLIDDHLNFDISWPVCGYIS